MGCCLSNCQGGRVRREAEMWKRCRRTGIVCAGLDQRGQVLYISSARTLSPPGARG